MKNTHSQTRRGISRLGSALALLAMPSILVAVASTATAASPLPTNVDANLSRLIAEDMEARGLDVAPDAAAASPVTLSDAVVRDGQGRVMVDILLRNPNQRDAVLSFMQSLGKVELKAEDMTYRGGILEILVPVNVAAEVARHRGVSAVHSVVPPVTDVGSVTQQGVNMHRVDQIANQTVSPVTGITGAGITIGVLSDSYNTSPNANCTTGVCAEEDVASGDLPGPGNPNNSTPVRVLEDFPAPAPPAANGNIDEGRAMCQLIHDIAPKANLAFATAFTGQVGFANNIRRLAAPITDDPATTGADCDIIVDDIIYFTEPMFSDGIVARAADDVAAQGVPYFSSAGNRPAVQGYFSDYRNVANGTGVSAATGNTALAGTNINLTGVPSELYAGGFHDFDPTTAQDVAQTVDIGSSATFAFQWDDPYDVNPVTVSAPFVSGTGAVPPGGQFDFTFAGNTDQRVQIEVFGRGTTPNFDAIVEVIAPDGSSVVTQDTGNGETLLIFLPQTGTYTVRVTEFTSSGTPGTGGEIEYRVSNASGAPLISTDFNFLAFRADGTFIGATGEDNINTNRPTETPRITAVAAAGTGATSATIQVVMARRNVPPATPQPASKVRYVTFTSGTVREYFSYTDTPITFGHNSAAGANGVAAYAFFPPNIPEGFTSPGFGFIAFDKDNNRLPQPEIRLKPDMAAMDGANNTFFGNDANQDPDTFPNFFGTSAAAPNAAAIAALVMEAKGGPGSVTPAQMRTILQRSAFPHDLDPYFARAQARASTGRVTITASADPNTSPNAFDFNIFSVAYTGTSSLTQLIFNPSGGDGTSGNTTEPLVTTGSTSRPGLIFDNRAPTTGSGPFTVGRTRGVLASDVSSVLSNPAPPPAVAANQFYTLTVNITPGALLGGEGFNFGLDRDETDAFGPNGAVGGNSADLLGASVKIPEGILAPGGMQIGGSLENGNTFSGVFQNRIGAGYSRLDGFGFINAQSAVNQPLP